MLNQNHLMSHHHDFLIHDTAPCAPVSSLADSTPISPRTPRTSVSSNSSSSKISKKLPKHSTKRRPRTSHIWNYSTINPEDGITLNSEGQEVWVCSMCKDKKTTYLLSGGTAAPIRHLLRVHKIEPCLSHSRPRRSHSKHHSESAINMSNRLAAAASSAPSTTSTTNTTTTNTAQTPATPSPATPALLPAPLMPFTVPDESPFTASIAAHYSLPPTPVNTDFLPSSPFGFPLSNPLGMAETPLNQQQQSTTQMAPSSNTLPHTPFGSIDSSSSVAVAVPTAAPTSVPSATPAAMASGSIESSPVYKALSRAASPTPSLFSTPMTNTTVDQPSPQIRHTQVNVEGAIKALLEMVIQYDIPASLIDSSSFKNFCVSLNPDASTALPTLKDTLQNSNTYQRSGFSNYTYGSFTNLFSSTPPPQPLSSQSWISPLDPTGLPETLMNDQFSTDCGW